MEGKENVKAHTVTEQGRRKRWSLVPSGFGLATFGSVNNAEQSLAHY